MRINGTYGFDPRELQSGSSKVDKAGKSDAAESKTSGTGSARSARPPLVKLAMAADEVNVKAVEEARRLLEAGELDTPAACDRVAEVLLDRGL